MQEPIITWYAKLTEDSQFRQTDEIYAGTYTPNNSIQVNLQIWNNRWGTIDVADLTDFTIHMYFNEVEDTSLFNYCTIVLNKSDILNLTKADNRRILEFPNEITLSGKKNNGTSKENANNYLNLDIVFQAPKDVKLKEKDLKSLFFEIVNL